MNKRGEKLALWLHALGWFLAGVWLAAGLILALTTRLEIAETISLPGWIFVGVAVVALAVWFWRWRTLLRPKFPRFRQLFVAAQIWYRGARLFEQKTQHQLLGTLAAVAFMLMLAAAVGYNRLGPFAFALLAGWALLILVCLIFFSRAYLFRPAARPRGELGGGKRKK